VPLRRLTSESFRETQLAELAAWVPHVANKEHIRYELLEHSDVLAPFQEMFGNRQFRRGLDVGVGPYGLGFLGPHLRDQIEQIDGLDPLPLIGLTVKDGTLRDEICEIRRRVNYIQGRGEDIPVRDGAYDIVACINVVDHALHPDRIMAEIRRVLKPGGVFVFGVNSPWIKARRDGAPMDGGNAADEPSGPWASGVQPPADRGLACT